MENKYITVAYKLYVMQDGQKTLVEEATVEHPFQFISGLGTTLERFETEITALKKGDKFEFVIPTAEAYGEYMPEGVRTVSKDMFTIDGVFDEERIFPGAVIPLQDNEGHHFYATVSEVTNDTVTVDLNHPHAGKDLTFEGEVVESRTATNEEIQEMEMCIRDSSYSAKLSIHSECLFSRISCVSIASLCLQLPNTGTSTFTFLSISEWSISK